MPSSRYSLSAISSRLATHPPAARSGPGCPDDAPGLRQLRHFRKSNRPQRGFDGVVSRSLDGVPGNLADHVAWSAWVAPPNVAFSDRPWQCFARQVMCGVALRNGPQRPSGRASARPCLSRAWRRG